MLQSISHFLLAVGTVIVTTFASVQSSISHRIFPPPPSWILSPTPLPSPVSPASVSLRISPYADSTTTPTSSIVNHQLSIAPSPTFTRPPTHTPTPTIPWGKTEKIAEHTYRTYIGQDKVMSTEEEFVTALNAYRRLHGAGELFVSDTLCKLADYRINQLTTLGTLDAHAGFKEYLARPDGWASLPRFISVGENNSYGYIQSGTRLIEWVFDADEEHRSNQLNPRWNRLCVRIRDTIVEVIFGQEQ